MTSSILFVCLGNICRSPAAEAVFRHSVTSRGLQDQWRIDSAGTIGYHAGNFADPRMRRHALQRGYQITSRARRIEAADLERFDWVVAMDQQNFADIGTLTQHPAAEVRLLSDFLDDDWPVDVPDPYYGGAAGFERVLDMVEAACPGLINTCRSPHG